MRTLVTTPFGLESTAAEVVAGIELRGADRVHCRNFLRLGVDARHRTVAEAVLDGPVLTVSLGTLPRPDGPDVRRKLREIRDAFDFVKFGDNPRARARVSPWAAAAVALAEGVEPIVHVGCRDRNRLALQSDLLGGRLLGVRNILCLRGDEIEVSDQPEARAVHDLDVVDLIGLAAEEFCVLAAGDPSVGTSDEHVARLRAKIAAGARLLETQPVFELDAFARWLRQLREAGIDVPMLVDVSLVATPTEAELLERIPFVAAPPDLPARLGRDRARRDRARRRARRGLARAGGRGWLPSVPDRRRPGDGARRARAPQVNSPEHAPHGSVARRISP